MKKIIDIAKVEIGYKEVPANSNKTKYGEWFGFNGVAWCGIFVSWVYYMAGFPLGNIGFKYGFAGISTAIDHFRKTNEFTSAPIEGDIVFFDWQGDGSYDHTGIYVTKVFDDYFVTIEGNTSVDNQSNGGEVMVRLRKKENVLFVHPKILDK
jgi:hypothetical protein